MTKGAKVGWSPHPDPLRHRLQRFALDPAASTVRHVREAPRVTPVDPGTPVEDRVTVHALAGSILATFTEHHWEEHTHFLRDGEVQGTIIRPVHTESTLELDGLSLAGMPQGLELPGFSAVFSGDRYWGPRDSCSGFGPEQTAVCSWTGTGPPTRYEAWLDADALTVDGLVRIRDFLSPQGAEYYTFQIQATAVPVPGAAWLLAGALAKPVGSESIGPTAQAQSSPKAISTAPNGGGETRASSRWVSRSTQREDSSP